MNMTFLIRDRGPNSASFYAVFQAAGSTAIQAPHM
jgi:hypothetical protein